MISMLSGRVRSVRRIQALRTGQAPGAENHDGLKALRFLGDLGLGRARQVARAELDARACSCCPNVLVHVYNRMGLTFFFDEDPEVLARSFSPAERAVLTPRVMAACIVLWGGNASPCSRPIDPV